MSETDLNGTQPPAPPAAEQPCDDCVSIGERTLAIIAVAIAVAAVVLAIDMFTGGKVIGFTKTEPVEQ